MNTWVKIYSITVLTEYAQNTQINHLRQAAVRWIPADLFRNILKIKMYDISLAILSVMPALHITSRTGDERRELQVTPGVPAQPLFHKLCLAGRWSWVQRVGRDEWSVKLAEKSRRKKSRSNPCICSWSAKWDQLALSQETGPESVCSLPGSASMAKSLIFRTCNLEQAHSPQPLGDQARKEERRVKK